MKDLQEEYFKVKGTYIIQVKLTDKVNTTKKLVHIIGSFMIIWRKKHMSTPGIEFGYIRDGWEVHCNLAVSVISQENSYDLDFVRDFAIHLLARKTEIRVHVYLKEAFSYR